MAGTQKENFFLWGVWGSRVIRHPFLTQKVPSPIKNIVIGDSFIIALLESGKLQSWGEDKHGCLGLGQTKTSQPSPMEIKIGENGERVEDIQYGKKFVLARTDQGHVYAWGDNSHGQLGTGDTAPKYVPTKVDGALRDDSIKEIVCVKTSCFALSNKGVVYAWGGNANSELALEDEGEKVFEPLPMTRLVGHTIHRLEVKCGETVVAFLDPIGPEAGGFGGPRGAGALVPEDSGAEDSGDEKIFEGVDLMRKVTDLCQEWWTHLVEIRHGEPYEFDPKEQTSTGREVQPSGFDLDDNVPFDILTRARYDMDQLIRSASAQVAEIRNIPGTKYVKFILTMFIDACRLRKEKVERTMGARQLVEAKRSISQIQTFQIADADDYQADIKKISGITAHLQRMLDQVRRTGAIDVYCKELQNSIIQTLECKMLCHDTTMECLRAEHSGGEQKASSIKGPLKVIVDRWNSLKSFSLYNLYQACDRSKHNFGTDDELLAWLVQKSDDKIDQLIKIDQDQAISRDALIPSLCYDLLVENAELRKMTNAYQLRVLMMQKGKPPQGHGRQGKQ
eukprot:CAMPEP_0204277826 /NCGR_PEP_ID=MMETSP0468-20130131/29522_1 /ASSEMBLY_ACC=CAM_ASM_000383 /TAXON_ID=2969 /ORGANISM="Oxyrrhis marina" /LENGTH=562 /DNA_ID=CAMNT_0051254665 /DNA_START=30 /DNA_END=1718 /DNA_ORIENTATION=+